MATGVEPEKEEKQLPWLVYLQGGPGMECRPPQDYGWVGTVLDKGYQVGLNDLVSIEHLFYSYLNHFQYLDTIYLLFWSSFQWLQLLLLDQRGTGLSSTITAGTLARQGNAVKQAEYLRHFRADNIVRDCEAIRKCLTEDYPEDKRKWSVIGQSFGGFCAVTYLSKL